MVPPRHLLPDGGVRGDDPLETIIEVVSHIIYIKDREGHYELINSAGEDLFELPRDEIVGRRDVDLFGPEEGEEIREIDEHVIESGAPATYESRREVGGEVRVFRNEKHPYRPAGEAIEGIVGVSRDVTDQVERQRVLERLHEATRELMVATDTEAVARIASETATEVLDMPQNGVHLYDATTDALVPVAWSEYTETVLGEAPPTILRDEGLAWEVYRSREPRAYADVRQAEALNEETPVRSELLLPLGDHGILLIGSVEVDDFDAADETLARVLAANVEAALDRVERERELARQNERLADFAGVVAHDLRNPLNVAQGRLELAREESDNEHLEEVVEAHERMGALVEDVLTWAREGQTAEGVEPVDLTDLARTCWVGLDVGEATLAIEEDLTVTGDLGRLRRVFENLFRNAVQHAGPDVTVRVGRLPEAEGFYVEDDGPGIPPEEREAAFDPGHTTSQHGTGFGLPIVREIIAGHGWTIELGESEAGGARFEIRGVGVGEA